MNDINEMPPKCQYCPYWEVCEYPWVCPDREQLATNLKQTCNQLATDTISRQAAKLKVARVIWEDGDSCYDFHDKCIDCLDDLPSAQPERKTGHWIKTARWGRVYYCDQCRNYLDFDGVNAGRGSTNFCPNCGADMRGERDE